MTELEYQKACRGTIAPFPNEYAWGDTSITDSSYSLENSYAANEGISSNYNTVEGNVACFNTHIVSDPGPFRVGIFAANASNTGRVTSGATYYGIMEMSGNLWERNITVGNPEGRSFTGTHGDGSLTSTGEADVTSWPGSTSVGSGFFGGNWKSNNDYLRVSNRHYGASQNGGRYHNQGGRGLRQAP